MNTEGGAITKKDQVRIQKDPAVEMPASEDTLLKSNRFERETHGMQDTISVMPWSEETPHGLPVDLNYQANHTPFDAIPPLFVGEDQILKDLLRLTAVAGISNHDPAVQQVVFQSLQPYPELAQAYLMS